MNDIERAVAALRAGERIDGFQDAGSDLARRKPDAIEPPVAEHSELNKPLSPSLPIAAPDIVLTNASEPAVRNAGMAKVSPRHGSTEELRVAKDVPADRARAKARPDVRSPYRHKVAATSVRNKPVLELPLESLMQAGFLVPDTPKGRMTEEYRRIKRPLLKNLRHPTQPENGNVVMVTSSITGEGKTYTAINLAMSFALERDRTVLFIDGDVIKRSAGKALGVPADAIGLTDLLSGYIADIEQAIHPTSIPNLSVLPAGSEHELANELLSSEVMRNCIKQLAERDSDRIIIIDSPPILQTNEANIITEYAGQIVFVVAEGDTPQKTVTQALANIDKDKYVGILANKSATAGKSYAYGYQYGYGYG